jgi:hypothetical protein
LTGIIKYCFLLIVLLCCHTCDAQTITLLASPSTIQILTPADVTGGKSVTNNSFTIGYPVLNLGGLSLDVFARAEFANLTSGTNTIPASKIGVSVVGLSGADPEIFLTTADQRILHQPPGLLTALLGGTQSVQVKYRVLGGAHLLVASGTYSVRIFYRVAMD